MPSAAAHSASRNKIAKRAGGAPGDARRTAGDRPSGVRTDVGDSDDLARIEEFLQSLARAVRQFHTYPAASAHCVEAVEACHRALARIEAESLVCVASPRELLVSGTPIGRDTLIALELARRLHDFRCKALDIDRSAT